jgi:hypothetical protein
MLSATRCAGRATGLSLGRVPAFLRETLRPALLKKHVEMFAGGFDFEHGVLRDDAAIVFDFHFELIVRQDSAAELQDFCEAVRAESMLDIAADVRLKDDRFVPACQAAAVDEIFHHVTDLGDMGMRRNGISVGQDKTRKRVGMLLENFSKKGKLHERSIFLKRNTVNGSRLPTEMTPATPRQTSTRAPSSTTPFGGRQK